MEHKLFINGQWVAGGTLLEVKNKFNGHTIAVLPTARPEDVKDAAIAAAERARKSWPKCRRTNVLQSSNERGADPRTCRGSGADDSRRGGQGDQVRAVAEVERAQMTFTVAAEEAKRLHGETIPLDAALGGDGYFGFCNVPSAGRDCRYHAVQFSPESGRPQGCTGHRLWQQSGSEAGQRHAVVGGQVVPNPAGRRSAGRCRQSGGWFWSDGGRGARHRSACVNKVTFTGSPDVGRQILSVGRDQEGHPGAWECLTGHCGARCRI